MNTSARPESSDPSSPTVAGYLRLRLENDGDWWKLFDSDTSRDELENEMTRLGLFRSPWHHRDFIENNNLATIVRDLRWNQKGQGITVPAWIELGFARLREVVSGRDQSRRALAFALALTPLCAMSPAKLKIVLGEQIDMPALCGHDDGARMSWLWFKSLLCTLAAFFWPRVSSSEASPLSNRDSLEMNDILRSASTSKKESKWRAVEEARVIDGDWLAASFQGHFRANQTMCWWWSEAEKRIRETPLDELIAARIIGTCQEDGLRGLWLKDFSDTVLSAHELRMFKISTDPWERIDRIRIPLTTATTNLFTTPEEFDSKTLPRPLVHATTGIPLETIRGFPCVPKQRRYIL